MDSDTGQRIIVMEDLAPGYWFPPPAHEWTQDEIRRIASAYARLHVQGHACLPSPAERFWMWRPTLYEREWDAEEILGKIQTLVGQEIWPPVKRIERLVAQTLADLQHFGAYPVTLLHNDVYPPNAALPIDPSNPVMILDWEMAGWGLAELDLAFMFMQPFHSTRRIDRGQTLAHYWAQRQALEGKCPPADERQAVQGHAEAVWALSLAATGYRVAADPFPSDSAAAAYWNSMFGVLYEHLIALCERL
jgi:Ser/Thr protein kinase RdoA (MazF antagonist)